eukprot:6191795-Pleurochrysis_carterae.AAC.2
MQTQRAVACANRAACRARRSGGAHVWRLLENVLVMDEFQKVEAERRAEAASVAAHQTATQANSSVCAGRSWKPASTRTPCSRYAARSRTTRRIHTLLPKPMSIK